MTSKQVTKVNDVMTPVVRSIHRTATVEDAMIEMRRHGVSSLAVERRDENDEFGIISVRDIAGKVIAEDRAPERVNVYEIMTKPVLSVPANMQTKYAVRLLVRYGVSRGLVVDANRLPIGIVTLRDMVLRHHEDDSSADKD
ncbi:MAG: CBS domain-containing protein [Magnetospiraceae bacterium]